MDGNTDNLTSQSTEEIEKWSCYQIYKEEIKKSVRRNHLIDAPTR